MNKWSSLGLFFIISLLSSCMMGMMNDHSKTDSHGSNHEKLIKEVIADKVKLSAEIPPVEAGKKVQFTIQVVDAENNLPITDAKISIRITSFSNSNKPREDEHRMSDQDSSHQVHSSGDRGENTVYEHQVNSQGSYLLEHQFDESGNYQLSVSIIEIGGEKLQKPVQLEVDREVKPKTKTVKKILGMHSITGYGVIIGAAMAVMMVVRAGWLFR